jgi:para-aminobenzoate synthetase/4-amino-4-deoxychorismate lyase
VYEAAKEACPGADDVVLWNERGEVTETTIANIVVDVDGELCTPPVTCGLLAGTFRATLVAEGTVRERVITLEMLKRSRQIYVVNSVRRWRTAVLEANA